MYALALVLDNTADGAAGALVLSTGSQNQCAARKAAISAALGSSGTGSHAYVINGLIQVVTVPDGTPIGTLQGATVAGYTVVS